MSHSVRRHLRLDIDSYDASIRRFIPGYEDMLGNAAQAVASVRPTLAVDLGAGTGALSEALLSHDAVSAVELVDVDPEMLEQARARLERFGDRVRLTRRSFTEPLSPCDAVAASLALHHISSLEAKTELYRNIFRALSPGGVLVNADVHMPGDEEGRRAAFRGWADHLVASGIAEEQAWKHFEDWSGEDTYFPLEAELAALGSVGFQPRCVWREGVSTVVVAVKPVGD